ncbi:signal peptidase I [Candidatus Eisenbacteria bacterium]|uniref:Signal peptidase I n=1 Tax=Eiseniibacteriota bacterium TaxID=2212470 RepID=A0ABV6YMB0_UNCEI
MPRTREEWNAEGREWGKTIVIVLIIFIPMITFVIQGYRIPSGSMEDTLLIGDFLFADKITYGARIPFIDGKRLPGLRDPEPGDIVIFKSPRNGETLIKRCVAVGGQTVEMRKKILFVDGVKAEEPFVKLTSRDPIPRIDTFGPITIKEGTIFCLGDNRDASADSRFFGPVDLSLVIAKADVLYFSFDTKKYLPRLKRIGKLL